MKFKVIQALMYVYVPCKIEEYAMKNEGARVATTFLPLYVKYEDFSKRSRAANSAIGDRICANFEHVRVFLHVLVTCKYKKGPMKNNREKIATPCFTL